MRRTKKVKFKKQITKVTQANSIEKKVERCPRCHAVLLNDPDQVFCQECGLRVNELVCPKCEKSISEDFKRCPYCQFELL